MHGVLRHLQRVVFRSGDTNQTDRDLLEAFIAHRDESAFAALVQRHGAMVLAVCRRVVGEVHEAEDAFQATFLVLARKADSIARRELLAGWLHGVAQRTAKEMRKRKLRRERRETQMDNPPQPAVEVTFEWSDAAAALDSELNRLPEKLRRPIIMCHLQGRSRQEAALELGIPEGTLSSRLATARQKLARRLARAGWAISVAGSAAIFAHGVSAAVPPKLAAATVRFALAFVSGRVSSSVLPLQVVFLTNRVVSIMWWKKMSHKMLMLAAFVCVAGVLVGVPFFSMGQAKSDGKKNGKPAQVANAKGKKPPIKKELLRYDGKPFAHWKNVLLTELKDGRLIEAIQAMHAFGTYGYGKESAALLMRLADKYQTPSFNPTIIFQTPVPETIAAALGTIGDEASPILRDALKSSKPSTRIIAVWAMVSSGSPPKALRSSLLELVKDKNSEVRRSAVQAIGKLPIEKDVIAALKIAIRDKNGDIRIDSIYSFTEQNGGPAGIGRIRGFPNLVIPAVTPALQDDNWYVRRAAIRLLGKYGSDAKPAVSALVVALKKAKEKNERLEIINALGEIGPAAREALPILAEISNQKNVDREMSEAISRAVSFIAKVKGK